MSTGEVIHFMHVEYDSRLPLQWYFLLVHCKAISF